MLLSLCKLIDWNPPRSDQKLRNQSFTVTADASPALRLTSTAVDSPAARLQKVRRGGTGRAVWRQANLKAIIDHQPLWLVWLQCARCNWQGCAIRFFNRKYILSHSISFKEWHHWRQFPKATASPKNWIHHSHQSEAAAFDRLNYSKCTFKHSAHAGDSRAQITV